MFRRIFLTIFVIAVCGSALPAAAQCGETNSGLDGAWTLRASNSGTQILWQKALEKPDELSLSRLPNSGIVAANNQLVFQQGSSISECGDLPSIISFDLMTGNRLWELSSANTPNFHYTSYASVFRSIAAREKNYVFISGDNFVFDVASDGQINWVNNVLPSRSLHSIYNTPSAIFLPSYSSVYALSPDTGYISGTIELPDVLGFYGDFAITADVDHHQLKVLNWPSSQEQFSVKLPPSFDLSVALTNLWPFVDVVGDTLLVYDSYFTPSRIQAYDMKSGEVLWTLEKPLKGFPAFSNDLMFVYDAGGLEIYDLRTGHLNSSVSLIRKVGDNLSASQPTRVWLAAYGNIVVINFRDTGELVAVRIPFI